MLLASPLLHAALAGPPLVHTLPNGLTVILDEDHRGGSVAVHLSVRVGARDETPEQAGWATLAAQLSGDGGAHLPPGQRDALLAAAGGEAHTHPTVDQTVFQTLVPAEALDLALFLESERLGFVETGLQPAVWDRYLARLQAHLPPAEPGAALVGQAARRSALTPPPVALAALQHPATHPYHPRAVTLADATFAGFLRFWERHYRPRAATLVLVGDFHTAAALAQVQRWFSDVVDPGPAAPPPAAAPHPPTSVQATAPTSLTARSWTTAPHGHDDEPALQALALVLSDRVQATQTPLSAFAEHHELCGHFSAWVDGPADARPAEALDRVMRQLTHNAPSTEAVQGAARRLVHDEQERWQLPTERAAALLDCYRVYGRPDCLDEQLERYRALTPRDLLRVASTYLSASPQAELLPARAR
jgi:zinc protease